MGGKSGSSVIGYKYLLGIHMGLSRGPVDELVEIQVGDRKAWPTGDAGAEPGATQLEFLVPPDSEVQREQYIFGIDYPIPHFTLLAPTIPYTAFNNGDMIVFARFKRTTTMGTADRSGTYQYLGSQGGFLHAFALSQQQYEDMEVFTAPFVSSEFSDISLTRSLTGYSGGSTLGGSHGYPATESKVFYINAPDLFGGTEREGGIVGRFTLMMGESTQVAPADLSLMLGNSLVSGFRGMCTAFYDGLVSSLNPYPKPWKFKVRRAVKGWDDDTVFYLAKAVIPLTVSRQAVVGGPLVNYEIKAMNPAHILYETLTNRDWGRGLEPSQVDTNSFTVGADTLYGELFGICIKWARVDTVEEFARTILDHVGGVIFQSRFTGKIVFRLLRNDYDPDDLPTFTMSTGVLSVEEDDVSMLHGLANEIIVSYIDAIDGNSKEVRVQNIAALQANNAIISKKVDYPGLPTGLLAARVADRDLRVHGYPLRRLKITMDRRGFELEPGGLFKFSDPNRNIASMVFRIGRIEDAPDSRIHLTVVQDVFGLAETTYLNLDTGGVNPSDTPVDAPVSRLVEASYASMLLARDPAFMSSLTQDGSAVDFLGVRPSALSSGFSMAVGSTTFPYTIELARVSWCPAMSTFDAITEASDTVQANNLSVFTLPTNALAVINDEIVKITSAVPINPTSYLLGIQRGGFDTLPQKHPANSIIYVVSQGFGSSGTALPVGDTAKGKFLTATASASLPISLASERTTPLVGRWFKPYPPGNIRVAGQPFYSANPGSPVFEVTWANRNRLTQSDIFIPHSAGTITPESGQTTTVIVLDLGGNILRTVSGLAGTSWSYDAGMWSTDGSHSPILLEVKSFVGVVESWQACRFPVTVETPNLAVAHSHWRLNVYSANGASSVAISEMEISWAVNAGDMCGGGGTPFASAGTAADAFDDSNVTSWDSGVAAFPVHLGYSGGNVDNYVVRELRLRITADVTKAPKAFQLQYSNDGIAWVTAMFQHNLTDWTAEETKSFVLPV